MLTILAVHEAHPSMQYLPHSPPAGTRHLTPSYTPCSSCPWGPGGNTSRPPCLLPNLQVPLMEAPAKSLSNHFEGVEILLLAGRFSA